MAACVLVIDDDPNVRESVAAFLEDYEYQVLEAASAEATWPLLEVNSVDAAVCDLRMPGTNGLEWLEQVKRRFPNLPVIVVSGAGVMNDVVRALRLGADDFLVKPILDLEVLHHALVRSLERARLALENESYKEYLEKTNLELQRGLEELRADQLAGRQVQLRMLPDPLEFKGIRCEHSITPSLLLSGDFLEYFDIDDRHLAFYIADVSGHGSSSAFVTVLLKNLAYRMRREFSREQNSDLLNPKAILERVNREVLEACLDKHLTMVYGVIDTQEQTLSYSIGGHLPLPVLLTQEGAQYLPGKGMPVGLFQDANYQNYQKVLPENFRLLLFSDGILEMIPESSLEQKEAHLLSLASRSQGQMDFIAQELGVMPLAVVPDDIAMMVLGKEDS
jgi:sigma-B regulation protein RsbU (phosphoserine phosphatase)